MIYTCRHRNGRGWCPPHKNINCSEPVLHALYRTAGNICEELNFLRVCGDGENHKY